MNFTKDQASVFKTCTFSDSLKAEKSFGLARTKLLSNSVIHKSFLWFQYKSTKNCMILATSCEQSLIKNE